MFSISKPKLQKLSVVELLAFIHVMKLILDGNGNEVDAILAEMKADKQAAKLSNI